MSTSSTAALVLAMLAAGCAAPDDAVLAPDLFAPTDLAVDGDRIVYTQANGEVRWVTRDGSDGGVIAAGAFTPRPGQIPVDASSIDVAVGTDLLAWTVHDGAGGRLWTAPRAGGEASSRASWPVGRIADVAARGDRLCWLTPVAVWCAEGADDPRLIAAAVNPSALALTDDDVYWLDAGTDPTRSRDGRLVTAPIDGGEPRVLAEPLADPRELAIVGDRVFWIDGGSCTEGDSGCIGNRDAALRRVRRDGGAPITAAAGMTDIGGLAVLGDDVYFCADSDVWRARGLVVEALDADHSCVELAADDGALFLATWDEIVRLTP